MSRIACWANLVLSLCLGVCLQVALMPPVAAQRASAALEGVVSDSTGGVVSIAIVKLTSEETSFTRSTTSNSSGSYSIPDVSPGIYTVSVEAPGFKKAVAEGLRLFVGPPIVQDFNLVVGQVNEQISVTATAPLLHTTTSEIGTVIEGKALTELPLNGRNFLQLTLLTPGVTRSKNSGTFDDVEIDPTAKGFNTNGGHMDYNLYLLDGVSAVSHGKASRICWAVHSAVGCAVTAKCTIRRRSCASTRNTYRI